MLPNRYAPSGAVGNKCNKQPELARACIRFLVLILFRHFEIFTDFNTIQEKVNN